MPLLKSTILLDQDIASPYGTTFKSEDGEIYFTMDHERWNDMGQPAQVTVAITPGNTVGEAYRNDAAADSDSSDSAAGPLQRES